MKRIDFHILTETLAKNLVVHPEFKDFLLTLSIDVADWPNSKATSLAQTYLYLREEENHEYAVHVVAQDARKLKADDCVPLEPGALSTIYRHELKKFRTKTFADKLSNASHEDFDAIISEFMSGTSKGIEVLNFAEQMRPLISSAIESAKLGVSIVSIPGFKVLSEAIGGFNPGRVALLVADTGFGKTNLSLNLARAATKVGPVLFINMEMTAQDLGDKIMLGATETSFSDYKSGIIDHTKVGKAQLVHQGTISFDEAKNYAVDLDELNRLVRD